MTHLVNTAITTLQQLGLVFSAIHRSSDCECDCEIYATLDVQETTFAANIIIEAHSQAIPRHPGTAPPGNCTSLGRVDRPQAGGGAVVGWALRNGGGGGMA